MRLVVTVLFCLSLSCVSAFADAPAASAAKFLEIAPIRFEPNAGLQPAWVRWTARGQGYSFAFTDRAAVLRLANRSVQLSFPGANRKWRFEGDDQQRAGTNYFIGTRRLSAPAYRRLRERGVYPGIDVVYYGNGREIEYDFEIAPGADPSRIRMRFAGADSIRVNAAGDLVLSLGSGEIIQRAPVVYQRTASGEIVAVAASYRVARNGVVRLELARYDPAEALIVDPTLTYAVYLSGSGADTGIVITHGTGGIYMAGNTFSTDFPSTANAVQPTNMGGQDVWMMQLDPTQGVNAIQYCSFLGGGADEFVKAIAVDENGVIYLTGSTDSGGFPVTASALVGTNAANTHGFVSMIDPSQGANGLIYSTYLGGSDNDEGDGIAVVNGLIYVTGTTDSPDFPVAGNSYQNSQASDFDAFVVVIDPTQSGAASEVYGSFLGGSAADAGRTIAVDSAGNVYVAGVTYSTDFPTTFNAFQPGYNGGGDGFLAEMNIKTGALLYSTFLGGSAEDEVKKMLIDPTGQIAMAGYTLSPDYPISTNAYQAAFGGVANAFVSILNLTTSNPGVGLTYSTYYGGSGGEVAYDLKRDSAGLYYLCGYTLSRNLPVTANALNPSDTGAGFDGFIAVINPSAPPAQGLVYGSYVTSIDGTQVVYGIDVDLSGNIYALGVTTSNIFPNGYAQNTFPGKLSAFLMIVSLDPTPAAVPGSVGGLKGITHPRR
jgi:hypothetical protein